MVEEQVLTKERMKVICLAIHNAIHSDIPILTIAGVPHFITIGSNGCRKLIWHHITFMEQNKNKDTTYGARARNGEKITWGIRPSNWILITDKEVDL